MNKKCNITLLIIFSILYILTNFSSMHLEVSPFSHSIYNYKLIFCLIILVIISFDVIYIYSSKNSEKFFDLKTINKTLFFANFSYIIFTFIDLIYTFVLTKDIYSLLFGLRYNPVTIMHFLHNINIYYAIVYVLFIIWILILKKKKLKQEKNSHE